MISGLYMVNYYLIAETDSDDSVTVGELRDRDRCHPDCISITQDRISCDMACNCKCMIECNN